MEVREGERRGGEGKGGVQERDKGGDKGGKGKAGGGEGAGVAPASASRCGSAVRPDL